MGSFWLLKLALKCIDLLSWPLLALGYPLCASIQAIETDSHSDTRNLISYWMLLSLIYLFEYAFLKLLQWFRYWPHIKLMIIIGLVIPDFGRASYVYDHLIHSCISMNLQEVISRFINWKKLSVKREIFLLQAKDYIKENGTEALEKLIASKNTMQDLDAEAVKAVPATEKNEMQQTIGTRLQMEQKYIKDLEMIEKQEVFKGKQANSCVQRLELKENTSTTIVETEEIAGKDTVRGDSPQSSASKKAQKEWTCAICQVTRSSEKSLNDHFYGKKHRATCEALKAKNQSVPTKNFSGAKKNDKLNEEPKMVFANAQHVKIDEENKSKGNKQGIHATRGMNNSRLRCEICDVRCTGEGNLASHLNGKKHLSKIQELQDPDL